MSEWVARTPEDLASLGFFADKICICYRYKYKGDWRELLKCEAPPTCADCGKWGDRVMKCCACTEFYYHLFQHPSDGYHPKPRRGWYCWNCLEREMPPIVERERAKTMLKIPPPEMVRPPGYELYKPKPFLL